MTIDLGTYSTFLFDFDGSLWNGEGFYDGALEFLGELANHDRDIVVVSNNSTTSGEELKALLAKCGVRAKLDAVTVVDIAGSAIRDELGACVVRVCGAAVLGDACAAAGHTVLSVDDPVAADAVLIGLDPGFAYSDLVLLAARLEAGERLYITNDDAYHPGPAGARIPETGAIAAAVLRVAPVEVQIIGKPSSRLFTEALARVGARAAAAIMIGDSLATDVDGAARLGITTAWISHGDPLPTGLVHEPRFASPTIRGLLDLVDGRQSTVRASRR